MTNNFKTGENGIKLIKHFEGCSLHAYQKSYSKDKITYHDPVTIGYGHTGLINNRPLQIVDKITQDKADNLLKQDLSSKEEFINKLVIHQLNQNQFDAIMCLVYNIGIQAFKDSTLLKLINENNINLLSEHWLGWDKAGGVILDGLYKRRKTEL